jgi:hypothetical protein
VDLMQNCFARQPAASEIVLFSSYALAGLALLMSHHLMPHAIAMVVIFVHLYEMYVGACSGSSSRCEPLGGAQTTWGPTTSGTGASLWPCTSPPSAPANGTARGMTR